MSLTSFLTNPDVRARFRQEFPNAKSMSMKLDLLAPPISKRYSMVGTAFDYLMRFYLQHLNPKAVTRRWVAEAAVELLAEHPPLFEKGKQIVFQAKKRLVPFLDTGHIADELIESSLLLAQLDPIFRAGRGHEVIGTIYPEDVKDLKNLLSIVKAELFTAHTLCLTNPTFGRASRLVGGADADLMIDDTLIDIKTRKEAQLKTEDIHQLLGYYALHELGGIGELTPKPPIQNLAIYFSRHGYLHRMEVSSFINPSTFPSFLQWFQERATTI
jgi:hypothetical protein